LVDEPPLDGIQWVEPKTENLDEAVEYLEGALCLLDLYKIRTGTEGEETPQ
jgi:hypothetical protein